MHVTARLVIAVVGGCNILLSSSAWAQSQAPTLFTAEFSAGNPGTEQIATDEDPLATVTLRPDRTVEILAVPDEATQREIGISRDRLLTPGTLLFGSSNRGSLFCNARSFVCFRDFDNDGAFEQAVDLDNAGLQTDVIVMQPGFGMVGAGFDERTRLSPPLAYRSAAAEMVPSFTAYVIWTMSVRSPDPEDYPIGMTFRLSEAEEEPDGSSVGSQCLVAAHYSGEPFTVHLYGNTITVLGFTPDGDLRYTIDPNPGPQTVGMIYQFVTNDPYIGIALAEDYRQLPCSDPAATSPRTVEQGSPATTSGAP